MLSATVLAVFFVPMFFVAGLHWLRVRPRSAADEAPAASLPVPQGGS
jgi:cbb3-type cytochrome oxidase subunit 3